MYISQTNTRGIFLPLRNSSEHSVQCYYHQKTRSLQVDEESKKEHIYILHPQKTTTKKGMKLLLSSPRFFALFYLQRIV